MRNGEPGMFIGLSTMRNGHVQLQWWRIQLFFFFNSAALPVVFSANQAVSTQQRYLISFVGLVMHVGLFLSSWRTVNWLKYWDEKLIELERLDQDESDGARVKVFSHIDFKKVRGGRFATYAYLWPIGVGGLFWLSVVLYNLLVH